MHRFDSVITVAQFCLVQALAHAHAETRLRVTYSYKDNHALGSQMLFPLPTPEQHRYAAALDYNLQCHDYTSSYTSS